MYLRLSLLFSFVAAIFAYQVGLGSNSTFLKTIVEATEAAQVRTPSFEYAVIVFGKILTVAMIGLFGTMVLWEDLRFFALKWWYEWKGSEEAGEYDFGNFHDVSRIVYTFAMNGFNCGFAAPFIGSRAGEALFAVASLPTIFQLIDMIGQRNKT